MIPLILSFIFSLVIVFYSKPLIPCFQIQEYEKEIRQLRTDHANCSYEVGICQSGHNSYKPSIPHFKKTVGIIVTTIGRSDFWDCLGGQALVMIVCWYSR